MISPIELTPEQRQAIYDKKAKRFMDGMQKLQEETGLMIVPDLHRTPEGAMIILRVVDRPALPAVDKPSV